MRPVVPAMRRGVRAGIRQAGFTLVELMIAVVLFSFAMGAILSVAVSLTNGFREQKLSVEAESAARAAMEFMGDAVRGASPGVSTGLITQPPGCLRTRAFEVVNNSATAGVSPGTDELYVVFASGSVVTSLSTSLASAATAVDVGDASQLRAGDWLVLTNFAQGHMVQLAANPTGNSLTVNNNDCGVAFPGGAYPIGTLAIRAQALRFYIDPNFDGLGPMLMMEAPDGTQEPIAEGVEDMQIALGREDDSPADGLQDVGAGAGDDDWIFNVAGETDTLADLRAVRITLTVRGRKKLTGTTVSNRPAVEDRAAGAADNYRRRTLTSIIEIRNLGGSP